MSKSESLAEYLLSYIQAVKALLGLHICAASASPEPLLLNNLISTNITS